MAFATKAESRYALTCSILPSVFQRVTQAYRLSKASPTSDQLCEGIVCSTTDATVNTGSENLKLLHRILFVATTDDTDERHYQWAALGAGSVDPSKRGFQDRPVAILAGQGVCPLNRTVNVLEHVGEKGRGIGIHPSKGFEHSADLSLVGIYCIARVGVVSAMSHGFRG